jgi:hypothetical protein
MRTRLLAVILTTGLAGSATVVVSNPAEAAAGYTVTVTAGASRVDVGQQFTLRGRVSPKARGERVLVQRLSGSSWTTVSRAKLNRHSRYAAAVRVTDPGTNRYRVVKPHSHHHPRGTSPTVTVVGWRWRTLTGLPVTAAKYAAVSSSGPLGPTSYGPYLRLGSHESSYGFVVYDLAGRCERLDAHVGVTSDSISTAQQAGTLLASTIAAPQVMNQIADESIFRGEDPVHVVRGPAVIAQVDQLQVYGGLTGIDNYVAWGGARVYCRF